MRHWIERLAPLQPEDLLVDAGCGTATFLQEMAGFCRVVGIDNSLESIKIAGPKIRPLGGGIIHSPLDTVELESNSASVVTLLDVLEHVDDDRAVLMEMSRITRPGGLIVITVPALKFLWSDWDVALHHRRRYLQPELLKLVRHPDLTVLRCSYFNTLALVPILAIRAVRKFLLPAQNGDRAEDKVPPRWLNNILRQAMVWPACSDGFTAPLGVSLLAILRKK